MSLIELEALDDDDVFIKHTGLPDGYWKRVVVGVCDLWLVAEPSQNKRERARSYI